MSSREYMMVCPTCSGRGTVVRRIGKARKSHPQTSHQAAQEAMRFTRQQREVLVLLKDNGPMTGRAIAEAMGIDSGTAAARLSELTDKRMTRRTGQTALTSTGRPAQLHMITKRGRKRLRSNV